MLNSEFLGGKLRSLCSLRSEEKQLSQQVNDWIVFGGRSHSGKLSKRSLSSGSTNNPLRFPPARSRFWGILAFAGGPTLEPWPRSLGCIRDTKCPVRQGNHNLRYPRTLTVAGQLIFGERAPPSSCLFAYAGGVVCSLRDTLAASRTGDLAESSSTQRMAADPRRTS